MEKPRETDESKADGEKPRPPLLPRLAHALKRNRSELLMFFFYFLVACFITWPMILNFSKNLFGVPSDNLGSTWLFWWFKNAGSYGSGASFCPIIGFPFGQNLQIITGEFLYEYSARFLLLFFNEIVVVNLFIFASFFLSGITMYYLVRHITKSKPASLIGGFAYTICVYHTFNSMFFPNLSMIQWIPLAILMLIRLIEKPDWKNAVFLWISLLLVTGTSIHYGLYTILFLFFFMAGYFIYAAVYIKKAGKTERAVPDIFRYNSFRKVIMFLLIAILATVIVVIPFFTVYLLNQDSSGNWVGIENTSSRRDVGMSITGAAKAKDYFIPNPENFTLGRISREFIDRSNNPFFLQSRNSIYIGWTVIIFAAVALFLLIRKKKAGGGTGVDGDSLSNGDCETHLFNSPGKRALLWGLSAGGIAAFILSLPPYWYVFNTKIPAPSLIFVYGAPWMRWYLRFGVLVVAAAIVIACCGVQYVLRKRSVRIQYVIAVVLLAIVFCETAIIPPFRYFAADELPEIYQEVEKLPDESSLVIYPAFQPGFFEAQNYLFFQRLFKKPLLNGGLENSDGEALRRTVHNPYNPSVPSILSRFGITHVLYRGEMFEQFVGTEPKEKEMVYLPEGLEQIHMVDSDNYSEDGYLFEVTAPPAPLVPFYTESISPPHIDLDRTTVMLLADVGIIRIENYSGEAVEADITLPIGNITKPHALRVLIEEEVVWEAEFDGDQEKVIHLSNVKVPKEGLSLILVPYGPEVGIDVIEVSLLSTPTAYFKLGDILIEPRISK